MFICDLSNLFPGQVTFKYSEVSSNVLDTYDFEENLEENWKKLQNLYWKKAQNFYLEKDITAYFQKPCVIYQDVPI